MLIGVHRAYERLSSSPEKQGEAKSYLTTLDIHSTVVVRNLAFLIFLRDLAKELKDGMGEE